MQIVIDIPEDEYNEILTRHKKTLEVLKKIYGENGKGWFSYELAVFEGTPLPKGHGRLIDADAIINNGISKGFCDWYDEIKYADTIVEADGGNTE